ncbi:MAG: diaminopimelate epimerase [Dehalococcoidia bacterium]|nr:Diaminopimelate epimerase [Chloroflexota bacterium]MBT9161095.1 Diaminopimelate epimerase [Chloroflexota bacterium]MBT9162830.1 Diaminopimelate epimerase [Chloroflexota bacterium]
MKFTKMQATGNDFVLLDAHQVEQNWPELARDMCRRHFGIGADGLILVLPSDKADFRMRMFNPDGSEAEACGNGLRCFVRYVIEKRLTGKTRLKIETRAGIREASIEFRVSSSEGGGVASKLETQNSKLLVRVAMGLPEFAPDKIPVRIESVTVPVLDYPLNLKDIEIKMSLVSMGNPHAVCFLDEPVAGFPLSDIGPQIEHHQVFPNRTNFEIVNVVGKRQLRARVWERGAGETLSCGSGACAIAVAARLHGFGDDMIEIELPGGTLMVGWDGRGEVWLSGPAETVFEGEFIKAEMRRCKKRC